MGRGWARVRLALLGSLVLMDHKSCVCAHVCLSMCMCILHTCAGVGDGHKDDSHNIFIPPFLSRASSLGHPTPTPHFPVFLMLQGTFPRYFRVSGILAFSLGMQTCWNVQSGSVESRGPIPPHPMPAHQLLLSIFSSHFPCVSPSSSMTLPQSLTLSRLGPRLKGRQRQDLSPG